MGMKTFTEWLNTDQIGSSIRKWRGMDPNEIKRVLMQAIDLFGRTEAASPGTLGLAMNIKDELPAMQSVPAFSKEVMQLDALIDQMGV